MLYTVFEEELEPWGFITAAARPRMVGSKKSHVRCPHHRSGVAHAAMLRGKHHNYLWYHTKNGMLDRWQDKGLQYSPLITSHTCGIFFVMPRVIVMLAMQHYSVGHASFWAWATPMAFPTACHAWPCHVRPMFLALLCMYNTIHYMHVYFTGFGN